MAGSDRDPYLRTKEWKAQRSKVLNRDGHACVMCGSTVRPEVDHIIARSEWPEGLPGRDDEDNLRTLCSRHHGAKTGREISRAAARKRASKAAREVTSESGFFREGAVPRPDLKSPLSTAQPFVSESQEEAAYRLEQGAVGWRQGDPYSMWELREPPPEGTWPRLMSKPHPRAVGSYGPEFVAWARRQPRLHQKRTDGSRWWQELVAYRALEHDAAGNLVWPIVLVTVSRQSGKSWLMRELCAWRLMQSERFGEVQTLVSGAHKTQAAMELFLPATRWAMEVGLHVKRAAGDAQIQNLEDGSRWSVQAGNDGIGVGWSLSMALLDEAWRIPRAVFDGALMPTMAESVSPQGWLVSTAGDALSDLVLSYRSTALATLDDPSAVLLIEWSAPMDSDLDDEDAWRLASSHWTPLRRDVIARARATATSDEFRSQWLNIWVKGRAGAKVNLWIAKDDWDAAAQPAVTLPAGPLVIAVEDYFGRGAAVALAGRLDGGRLVVTGSLHLDRTAAYRFARKVAEAHEGSKLIVGLSLVGDPPLANMPVSSIIGHGSSQTRAALPVVRELLSQGDLVHDGAPDLTDQVTTMQVLDSSTGLSLPPRHPGRTDLARCAAWAVLMQHRNPPESPAIF